MFRIGEFSKMGKTTVKALRYYDEVDLLKPEDTDKFTSYRFYNRVNRESRELARMTEIAKIST